MPANKVRGASSLHPFLPSEVLTNAPVLQELLEGNQDADRRWLALSEEQRQESEVFRGLFLEKEGPHNDETPYHFSLFGISEVVQCVLSVSFNEQTKAVTVLANGYECSSI